MTDEVKKPPSTATGDGVKGNGPTTPGPAAPKAVTIDDVNATVAEAVTGIKADLEAFVTGELETLKADLGAKLEEALKTLAPELIAEFEKFGDDVSADGITAAVRHELHHLHGLIDNVATTIERSIGQRVSRNVAPRPEGQPLPSQIDAPPVNAAEGPETAASIG